MATNAIFNCGLTPEVLHRGMSVYGSQVTMHSVLCLSGRNGQQTQAVAEFAGDEDSDDNERGIVVRANLHIHATNVHIIICSLEEINALVVRNE